MHWQIPSSARTYRYSDQLQNILHSCFSLWINLCCRIEPACEVMHRELADGVYNNG